MSEAPRTKERGFCAAGPDAGVWESLFKTESLEALTRRSTSRRAAGGPSPERATAVRCMGKAEKDAILAYFRK